MNGFDGRPGSPGPVGERGFSGEKGDMGLPGLPGNFLIYDARAENRVWIDHHIILFSLITKSKDRLVKRVIEECQDFQALMESLEVRVTLDSMDHQAPWAQQVE